MNPRPALGTAPTAVTTPAPLVGTAPANWNNDDLPGWSPALPFSTILAEAAAAGYAGIEYGDEFPTEPADLTSALSSQGLLLAGCYRWLHLRDDAVLATELTDLDALLTRLAAAGSRDLIVADAMPPERIAIAGQVPADGSRGLDEDAWEQFGRNLRQVGAVAADHGVRVHYHNHAGSYVEAPHEIERLLPELRPGLVDLGFDMGHYAYGGGDPAAFVAQHQDVIGYLHLKDVDSTVLATVRAERLGFLDALKRSIFSEFGDGMVEIPRVVNSLCRSGYSGWIIVEQDTSPRPPVASAAASRRFLREHSGL